jgi:HPt (histidine-containing phosphotransfer) domain-containing protein
LQAPQIEYGRPECQEVACDMYLNPLLRQTDISITPVAAGMDETTANLTRGPINQFGIAARELGSVTETNTAGVDQAPVVFDADGLLLRLLGDRRLAGILLKAFVGDVPSQLSQLRRRLDEGDAPAARFMAHALKGAAATVSAEGLSAIALAMEESGQLDRCAELLPRLVEEFGLFKSAVELAEWQ